MSAPRAGRGRDRLVLLHAERDLIVIDKPAGLLTMPSAPGRGEHEDSVLARAREYARHKRGRQAYVGLLHRLDRGTSGALAVALSHDVHAEGRLLFKAHRFDRTYLALVSGVPEPLEGTIEGWRSFVQARSAYARVKALLLNSPLNLERLRLPRPAGYLNVERILYVPPPNKKVILNGISFQLKPGESLAIVGDSGTGKTMLARMLVGSIIPTAGSVRLDMMDLRNWDPRQFGESVGYLPQDVQLFPASIKANIGRMRDDARDEDVFDAAETADVHEMISSFAQGYETIVGMDGSPLSGGQRQRIGLARAFYGNPRLIVLDEPNSNLDANGERALAKALLRAKEKQITVVTITQRAALLMSVDKIMILHQGAVQAFGSRDEIIPMITGRKPNNVGDPPSLN